MNSLPDGQLVGVKSLGSTNCHWLVSSNFSPCCSHDASKQTPLLFCFTPVSERHKCLLDGLAPGIVQPPQLISFLASCLLVNIDEMSKRMCGYGAVIQGFDYDYAFGHHHFQIAYYEHIVFGMLRMEGKACAFLFRE